VSHLRRRALRLLLAVISALLCCRSRSFAVTPYQWTLPPGFPQPSVPDDNPMSVEKVALGRFLFYDTRMSGNETNS
jgi:cytochrome c peroxidase